MKTILITISVITLLISCKVNAQVTISLDETKTIITTLASDEMNGRDTGSEGYNKSAQYVEDYLKMANFQPLFSTFKDSALIKDIPSYNIVGIAKPFDASKRTIILSGHLDHIGTTSEGEDRIMNGANDNASGVTAALQVGKYLSTENHDENIIVALFTGEEKGLQGSAHLAKRMNEQNMKPDYVFNFEMIGTTLTDQPGNVYVTGYDMSNMAEKINEAADFEFVQNFKEEKKFQIFYRSDNYPFYKEFNIPAQTFSSFDFSNFDYYHHVDDEIEALDLDNMNLIINNAATILSKFLSSDSVISLNK